jgi:ATP-dependent Clp protease adaptor protein ClpS
MSDRQTGIGDGEVLEKTKLRTQPPPMYRVLLHNDDYTTQEFVVMILEAVFRKNMPEAITVMLAVHNNGVGIAGVYSHEVAETKINKVHALAKAHEYPLQCTMEAD